MSVYSYKLSVYSCKVSVLCYKVSVYSYTDLSEGKATAGRAAHFKKFVTENAHPDQDVFSKGRL